MKFLTKARSAVMGEGKNIATALVLAGAMTVFPDAALAQADPFANAAKGAEQFRTSLTSFALVIGGIGMVACLMLGFFGKLNWKWVATGVGVSFSLAIVPGAITWLANLAGAS